MVEMAVSPDSRKWRWTRRKNPYRNMDGPDIRPDNIARQNLSDAENLAAEDKPESSTKRSTSRRSSVDTLLSKERSQRSDHLIRNSVRGRNDAVAASAGAGKFGFKGRSRFRRAAPATIITGLLVSGAFLFFGAQSALGPTISNLYTEATDVQFTSYGSRNTRLFKYMLDGGDQIKINPFKAKYQYTTFSPYMKNRLKQNGIEVGKIDVDGNFVPSNGISTSKTVLRYNGETIDAANFQNKFISDLDFQEAYYKAKRGRIAGFFDVSADRYYAKKKVTRDIFANYTPSNNAETDNANFRNTVSEHVTGTDADLNLIGHRKTEDGEDVYENDGDSVRSNNIAADTPEAKARIMVNDIAAKASQGGAVACAVLKIGNMAAVTVSAYQIYQSISYYMSLMESISKMMAGEGDASAINATLNFLTTETTNEIAVVNPDGTITKKIVTGSPIQASGPKLVLGNTRPNSSDVAPYSIDTITKAANNIALSTAGATVACDGILAANAVISLASNAMPGGTLANFAVRAIVNTVQNIAIAGAISAIVSAVIPYVAKIFASNIFEEYTGIPAGELFSNGGANANFKLATQGSGFMPASEEYVDEQNKQTTYVLAQEAELDRRRRSPFDITSKNTFLGSLLTQFSYISNQNSLLGYMSSIAGTISNAFGVFNPSVGAYDGELSYTSNYQDCSMLGDSVCDMYGNNIVGMDYSTIDLSPDDPTYISVINPNLDDEGNIIDGSELSKFINACVERESPWGVLDVNIVNALQTSLGVVGDNIYIIEDVIDIVNAAEDVANQAWGTGDYCKMSSDNPRWENEFRYYQRYVEDMRILNGMRSTLEEEKVGSTTNLTNPVIAYRDTYEAAHPIDTSFEGTLARISGYSKDDISFLLEFSRYSDKLAQYNPSERYAFGSEPSFTRYDFSETNYPETAVSVRLPEFFTDKRNYTV